MLRKIVYVLGGLLALVALLVVLVIVLVDADDYRAEIAERASDTLGREVRLEGPLSLRVFPRIALEIRALSVANPDGFGDAPALAEVGSASVTVAIGPLIRGELDIGTVRLRDATVSLVTLPDGASNLDGLLAEPSAEAQTEAEPDLSGLSLAGLELKNVAVQIFRPFSDEVVRARIDELTLDGFRAGALAPLSVRASLLDEASQVQAGLSLQGDLRVATNLERIDLEEVSGEFEAPASGLAGQVGAGVSLDLGGDVPIVRLSDLAGALDLNGQALALEASETLVVRLADPVSAQVAGLELAVNGQPLAISGSFALSDRLTGELAIAGEELDLRPWLSSAGPGEQPDASPSAEQVDFSSLVGPRLSLELDLDRLAVADDLVLDQVAARASLVEGVLTLDPMQAQGLSGRFSGVVTIDFNAAPPQVRANPRFDGVDVQQLVRLLSPAAPLRGLGELDVDLRFSGLSAAEIVASLDGEGRFSLDEGALLGVDLQRLIEEEIAVSNLSSIRQAFGGETPFRSLSGRIQADSGVVAIPDLRLQANGFGLSGDGEMDLAAGEVAYQLDLELGQALIERLPRALARATDGVIPLTIAGPISRPLVRVDLAAMAEGTLQRELQDRLFDRLAPDEETETETTPDREAERETDEPGEERTSDLLLRALRERRERDEPPPDDPPGS